MITLLEPDLEGGGGFYSLSCKPAIELLQYLGYGIGIWCLADHKQAYIYIVPLNLGAMPNRCMGLPGVSSAIATLGYLQLVPR